MIEIIHYEPLDKGSHKGFIDVKMHKWGGWVLAHVSLMQKGNSRWISFPAYKKGDGEEIKWLPTGYYESSELQKRLTSEILKAFDEYIKPTKTLKAG